MTDLKQWRKQGKHLPAFMRDFHDQKNLFKTIHELYHSTPREHSTPPPDWIQAHTYTIDSFLWFMAAHGWTLQRNATKSVQFYSIDATLRAAQEKRDAADVEMLKAWLAQGKEVKP